MANRARHSRASSVPSSPTRDPHHPLTKLSSGSGVQASPAAPTTPIRATTHTSIASPTATGTTPGTNATQKLHANDIAKRASLLQPRVAVVLDVPRPWHLWLFVLRLSSILPAVFWGTPSLLQLILRLLELILGRNASNGGGSIGGGVDGIIAELYRGDPSIPLTETGLAVIWCFASGYLSFFFTDCLMSRWLINYTPQATMVRLLTINAVNAYVTSMVLSLAGGFQDPRLLLPGWIGIATTLTVCYHITHQKINIRKETSTSVNVFSIASYISMVTLLAHMHISRPDYPSIPLVVRSQKLWDDAWLKALQVRDTLEQFNEL